MPARPSDVPRPKPPRPSRTDLDVLLERRREPASPAPAWCSYVEHCGSLFAARIEQGCWTNTPPHGCMHGSFLPRCADGADECAEDEVVNWDGTRPMT